MKFRYLILLFLVFAVAAGCQRGTGVSDDTELTDEIDDAVSDGLPGSITFEGPGAQ